MRYAWLIILIGLLGPSGLQGQQREGAIVGTTCPVTWIASVTPGVREYRLYVSKTKGSYGQTPNVTVQAPTTQSTCQALGLTEDGQYYAVVRAVHQTGGQSPNSNESPFYRDTTIPASPTGLTVGAP